MQNKRSKFSDRRHGTGMRWKLSTDSNGDRINKCRRKTLDRRVDNIQAVLVTLNSQTRRASPGSPLSGKQRR